MKMGKVTPIALTVLIAFAPGCSSGKSGGNENGQHDDTGKNKPVETPSEPVELTLHGTMSGFTEDFMKTHFGTYIGKKFPNVKLKFLPTMVVEGAPRNTTTYLAAGQKFDLMNAPSGSTPGSVLENGLQLDLTPYVKKYNFDLNRIEPSALEIQKRFANGGVYGIPFTTNTLVLFYNKDLFSKFGVPLPTSGTTWDELNEAVKKLSRTEAGVAYRGLTATYWHMFLLNQRSVPGQDAKTYKALYTNDAYKKEMEFITGLFKIPGNGWSTNPSIAQMVDSFVKGTSAMYVGLDNTWQLYKFPKELNWDMIRLPERKEAPGTGPQTYPNYMYVTNMSANKDIAFQVIASLASEEFQTYYARQGYLPILKDNSNLLKQFGADVPELTGKNKDIMWPKLAAPTEVTKFQSVDLKYEQQIFADIVTGKKDINTALRDAAEAHDKEVAAQLSK
ncbi:MAG: extracellular solute-binding protein family 1 [Paenibacillus sp.]|jgi:multiple sugar transport system substrate-binding protein|nr:extracellular solute-binding protein family 1 [Paenibacillus sp.]